MPDIWSVVSTIASLASLILAVAALQLSRRVLLLTSKDYIPLIQLAYDEKGEVEIINNDHDLFKIYQVAFMHVEIYGYENSTENKFVQIPIITTSRMKNDLSKEKAIVMSKNTAFAQAYIAEMSEEKVNYIQRKINCIGNKEGYALLPSCRSRVYYVVIDYRDKFNQTKTLIYENRHYHGSGYHQRLISDDTFNEKLQWLSVPNDLNEEMLWNYLVSKYSYKR